MKTLKSIFATLLFAALLTSCSKKELKPYVATGEVTYKVTSTNNENKLEPKHVVYGYENVIKDTVAIGDFEIKLKVPACNNSNERKKIFISCETTNNSDFKIEFNQFLEFANNKLNFSLSNSGSCSSNKRSISDYFYVNAE